MDVTPDTAATVRNVNEIEHVRRRGEGGRQGAVRGAVQADVRPQLPDDARQRCANPACRWPTARSRARSCTQTVTVGTVSMYCSAFLPDADGTVTDGQHV